MLRCGLVDAALRRYMGVKTFKMPRIGAKEKTMNHHPNHYDIMDADFRYVDLVEIEHQARILRARIVADGLRAGFAWLAARVKRAPNGQTA